MTTLDRAYNQAAAIVKNKTQKASDLQKNFWRGRKIIPLEEWQKINFGKDYKYSTNPKMYLKFIPDTYNEYLVILPITSDVSVRKERSEWFKDYIDYVEYIKDPALGRSKCNNCPFVEPKITFGIKKMIKRYLEKNSIPI